MGDSRDRESLELDEGEVDCSDAERACPRGFDLAALIGDSDIKSGAS